MKKDIKTNLLIFIIIIAFAMLLIPSFQKRIENEQQNDNVTISLFYNTVENRFRGNDRTSVLQDYLDIGVTNVNISEVSAAELASNGRLTNITYGELAQRYDAESMELVEKIHSIVVNINMGSQVLIAKDEDTVSLVRNGLSERYDNEEYGEVSTSNGITAFVICDKKLLPEEILFGFDESSLEYLSELGFEITLNVKLQNYNKTECLNTLEHLIQKYDIQYLVIQESQTTNPEMPEEGKMHYEGLAKMINENQMVLVVQETRYQLSNDEPFGYNEIFEQNSDQVLRAYGAYALKIQDGNYMNRYQQFLNSTIDRNIRFIMLDQVDVENSDYVTIHGYSLEVAEKYISKIREFGYTVNEEPPVFDYEVNLRWISAIAASIMVLLAYLMFVLVTGCQNKTLVIGAVAFAVLMIPITCVLPDPFMVLYPTAWSMIMPCFALTVVFDFAKKYRKKLNTILFVILIPVITVILMCAGGMVISCLLSGIEYYFNNAVFRGVKLSLLVPIVYSLIAYYWMFAKEERSVVQDVKKVLLSDIKVYWVLLAAIVGTVGMIYIIRSGTVMSISGAETMLRNFLTNTFAARPRTKEFLIGYPCLVLFAYYIKKVDVKLLQAGLAAGSSILFASISNSFCHVFTDVSTIYMRVLNGLLIGAVVSAIVYIGNLLFIKAVKYISKYFK